MANELEYDPHQKYKLDELKQLGFSEEQALTLLTVPGLQVANIREKFIKKGCSIDQVYRILA